MSPRCLTVLAPLRPEAVAALRSTLRDIGDDINGRKRTVSDERPHVAFTSSHNIHFARFAILTDPDRGPDRMRLLFASVYDGTLDSHLDELASITTDMHAIWGACEGYTDAPGFHSFIRTHAHEPAAYYIAFRDASVPSITGAIDARKRRHAMQDDDDVDQRAGSAAAARRSDVAGPIRRAVARIRRAAPILVDIVRAVARFGIARVYVGTQRIIASLGRYPIFRLTNAITGNRMPPLGSPFSSVALDEGAAWAPLAEGDEVPFDATVTRPSFREDAVAQNQLTVVTVIGHGSANRVGAVMSAIDSYARRLAPSGSLIGISTIHFVRWLIIDNGRRLMMVSDYDGSWEAYIDEFAEMIVSGLDAIWETAIGVPPDGARDLPAFKRFLRTHQVPAEVFFAAYPNATVLNVAADLAFVARAGPGTDSGD